MIEFAIGTALSLFGLAQSHIGGIKQGKTDREILGMLQAQLDQQKSLDKPKWLT